MSVVCGMAGDDTGCAGTDDVVAGGSGYDTLIINDASAHTPDVGVSGARLLPGEPDLPQDDCMPA